MLSSLVSVSSVPPSSLRNTSVVPLSCLVVLPPLEVLDALVLPPLLLLMLLLLLNVPALVSLLMFALTFSVILTHAAHRTRGICATPPSIIFSGHKGNTGSLGRAPTLAAAAVAVLSYLHPFG